MPRSEILFPVSFEQAREALRGQAAFLKRTQIEDSLFEGPSGALARIRRQDTVTRLMCSKPLDPTKSHDSSAEASAKAETVVLDPKACRALLGLCGFKEVGLVRIRRETWRKCQYALHLDRIEGVGEAVTLESESGGEDPKKARKLAKKFLSEMGVELKPGLLDNPRGLPYTAPIEKIFGC